MSDWAPAARSAEARRVYAAAEADRAERPQRYRLGVEELGAVVETATAGRDPAGLGDPDQWRPGLEHYLASADEDGRLNALGARMVRDTAAGRLRARAALAGYTREHPTVPERALRPRSSSSAAGAPGPRWCSAPWPAIPGCARRCRWN